MNNIINKIKSMDKKLLIRILGAVSAALIIVSVFVPFVSNENGTQSIWGQYTGFSMYLPIMIIAFGILGVIIFSINMMVETAYISTGAIAFFTIMQTAQAIIESKFSTFALGYYFIGLGTVILGIMTFLSLLMNKEKNNDNKAEEKVEIQNNNQDTSFETGIVDTTETVLSSLEQTLAAQSMNNSNTFIPVQVEQSLTENRLDNEAFNRAQFIDSISTENTESEVENTFIPVQPVDEINYNQAENIVETPIVENNYTEEQPVVEQETIQEAVTEPPVEEYPVYESSTPIVENNYTEEQPVVEQETIQEELTETPVEEYPVYESSTPIVENNYTEEQPVVEQETIQEEVTETPVEEYPVYESSTPIVENNYTEEQSVERTLTQNNFDQVQNEKNL